MSHHPSNVLQAEVTRAHLIAWEAAGKPMHFCHWNRVYARTGVDACCSNTRDCENKVRNTEPYYP